MTICVDCGADCPPRAGCAAGCGRPVCDACYIRHCVDGCAKARRKRRKSRDDDGWSYTPFAGGYLGFEDDDDWDDDDPKTHRIGCQCETCLQNYPEWEVLYGDDEEE